MAILARGDRTRVPELVPVRYERMLTTPFAFLRGAAAVMAEDLRHQPIARIAVQACGDYHLMNFGAFATPEENILFDINDFDETLPGVDFMVDLKRLAASVAAAALAAKFSNKRARATAAATVEAYRTGMRALAKLSPLEIWHSRIELWSEIKNIAPVPPGQRSGKIGARMPRAQIHGHPGRRVVEGQHIMQAASDVFLGWTQDGASGRHFYVRQLKNRRLGSISELVEENALINYARLCGRTLARAHAHSADPAVLAGYMGKSDAFAAGIFRDGLRGSHAKGLRSAREIEAQSRLAAIGTAGSSHDIGNPILGGSEDPLEPSHELYTYSPPHPHLVYHHARWVAAFGLWCQQHPDL